MTPIGLRYAPCCVTSSATCPTRSCAPCRRREHARRSTSSSASKALASRCARRPTAIRATSSITGHSSECDRMPSTTDDTMQGVFIKPLKLLPNARGHLMEVQRRDDAEFPGFGQAYVTQTFRGVVKAWYRHRLQIDQL